MRINYQLFKLFGGCFFQIPSRKKKRETNDIMLRVEHEMLLFGNISLWIRSQAPI
jgi:hypothetical protein